MDELTRHCIMYHSGLTKAEAQEQVRRIMREEAIMQERMLAEGMRLQVRHLIHATLYLPLSETNIETGLDSSTLARYASVSRE